MTNQATCSIHYSRFLGTFGRAQNDSWILVGQDGGQSIDLGNGTTLFLFSDTLVTPTNGTHLSPIPPPFQTSAAQADHFLANCAAVGIGNDIRSSVSGLEYFVDDEGVPFELVPTTDIERSAQIRFWPLHGVMVSGEVQLFYIGVQTIDPTSLWGFRNIGVGMATLDPATGVARRIRHSGDWRLWNNMSDDFHFGVHVVLHKDHAYVFGSHRHAYNVEAVLGRAPIGDLTNPEAFTYLRPDDGTWSTDPGAAGSLGPCGSDYSVSFNPYLGRYLMTYIDSFTKLLTMRIAPELTGPFSDPIIVGRVPHRASSKFVYLAFEHAQFAQSDGRRVYVSYCEPEFQLNSLLEIEFD